jgi:2-polyprenyl-3-methyl-5-hydroxy-6-metoxy-1,4-benzoquinol methylase
MAAATDYLSHDAEYRRRRSMGRQGWDEEGSFRQTLAAMEAFWGGPVPRVKSDVPTLIEFGCGAGDLAIYFASHKFNTLGIDIAPFAIEWAREKAASRGVAATFMVADLARELESPPPAADVVLDGHCLHCIIGKDRRVFLRNAHRCVRPGGLFHVNTMCGTPHGANAAGFDPRSGCIIHQGVARRYFGTAESILEELAEAGFRVAGHRVLAARHDGDEDCLLVDARRESSK